MFIYLDVRVVVDTDEIPHYWDWADTPLERAKSFLLEKNFNHPAFFDARVIAETGEPVRG